MAKPFRVISAPIIIDDDPGGTQNPNKKGAAAAANLFVHSDGDLSDLDGTDVDQENVAKGLQAVIVCGASITGSFPFGTAVVFAPGSEGAAPGGLTILLQGKQLTVQCSEAMGEDNTVRVSVPKKKHNYKAQDLQPSSVIVAFDSSGNKVGTFVRPDGGILGMRLTPQ